MHIAEFGSVLQLPEDLGIWTCQFDLVEGSLDQNDTPFINQYLQIRDEIQQNTQCNFQIFDPTLILSPTQINLLVYHVNKAFEMGNNIASSPAVEFLLYLSHQRQIQVAIDIVGVKDSKTRSYVSRFGAVIFGPKSSIEIAIENCKNAFSCYIPSSIPSKSKEEILQFISDKNISDQLMSRFPRIIWVRSQFFILFNRSIRFIEHYNS